MTAPLPLKHWTSLQVTVTKCIQCHEISLYLYTKVTVRVHNCEAPPSHHHPGQSVCRLNTPSKESQWSQQWPCNNNNKNFQWLLSFCIYKWRKGYLLATLALKITCRCFNWILQLSSVITITMYQIMYLAIKNCCYSNDIVLMHCNLTDKTFKNNL